MPAAPWGYPGSSLASAWKSTKPYFHAKWYPEGMGDSWKALMTSWPRIGTLNVEQVGQCRQKGAADVLSAELFSDSSAGQMPAAPCGSRKTRRAQRREDREDKTFRLAPAAICAI